MKKNIDQLNLRDKKVIIRVDFNVPMQGSKIASNVRIIAALPTIEKVINDGAKVILLSHLGRIKEKSDLSKKSLKPIAKELSNLLKKEVKFVSSPTGDEVIEVVNSLKSGEVVMLENTRWEDINDKSESKNNSKLGEFWASLADIFINDAFGISHRSHASNVGIASKVKESAIGYLVKKEIDMLSKAIYNPSRPAIAIIGGAKVSDKIQTIENLIQKVDKVIIAGGMAFTFWKAQGLSIGNSVVENDQLELATQYLKKYQDKIVLPIDAALSTKFENTKPIYNNKNSLEIPSGLLGLDIGPKSIKLFINELKGAKTVIWNGPLGVTEFANYAHGTEEIAKAIGELNEAYTVVGGGDSVAAITKLKLESKFSHISTGGGACLSMLEGKELPGIKVIQNENEGERKVKSRISNKTLEIKVKNTDNEEKEKTVKKEEKPKIIVNKELKEDLSKEKFLDNKEIKLEKESEVPLFTEETVEIKVNDKKE